MNPRRVLRYATGTRSDVTRHLGVPFAARCCSHPPSWLNYLISGTPRGADGKTIGRLEGGAVTQAIIGSVARRPRPPTGHSVAKVPAFVTACEGGARADAEICLSTLIADTAVESVAVLFA